MLGSSCPKVGALESPSHPLAYGRHVPEARRIGEVMAKHLKSHVVPDAQAAYPSEPPSRTPAFELRCGPLHVTLDCAPLKLLALGSTVTAGVMGVANWLH